MDKYQIDDKLLGLKQRSNLEEKQLWFKKVGLDFMWFGSMGGAQVEIQNAVVPDVLLSLTLRKALLCDRSISIAKNGMQKKPRGVMPRCAVRFYPKACMVLRLTPHYHLAMHLVSCYLVPNVLPLFLNSICIVYSFTSF